MRNIVGGRARHSRATFTTSVPRRSGSGNEKNPTIFSVSGSLVLPDLVSSIRIGCTRRRPEVGIGKANYVASALPDCGRRWEETVARANEKSHLSVGIYRKRVYQMVTTILKNLLIIVFLCGALILVDVLLASAQSRGASRVVAQAQSVTGDSFNYSTTTPRGVRVYANRKPRVEMLRAIDSGLTELFAISRRHGYNAQLNFSSYVVFIARADRTQNGEGAYSPDIAVGASQYAGSVYDQGGYVYAAGMVLAYQPNAFIIADHQRDFQRVANVARYEGEHIVLYHNDPPLYRKTLDHSRGGSHPILQ